MDRARSEFLPCYTVGTDAYESVASVVSPYGTRAVLIGGRKALAAGEGRLREALAGTGVEVVATEWYGGESSHANARRLAAMDAVAGCDMVFAMGGGRAVDCCKEVAELVGRPLFTFPTVASNCAPVTAIGVFYKDDGSADDYFFPSSPPAHCFIDLTVLAQSPDELFWAGVGDALSKGPEVELASRDLVLEATPAMGRAIAATCEGPLFSDSEEALAAKRRGVVTEAFEAVVLDIIVTCGIVSNMTTSMVDPDHAYYYNSSVAHAFYNAWTGISPELVEEHPHGAVVAFGVLVLWAFDGRMDELARYTSLNRRLGLPVTLSAIGATAEDVPGIVERAQATNEWGRAPYGYTAERFGQAVLDADFYGRALEADDPLAEEAARIRVEHHAPTPETAVPRRA